MFSRSQNDSNGGEGQQDSSASLNCPSGTPNDEGSPQPQTSQTDDGPPNPGLNKGQLPHAEPVLSLDQIRVTGSSNEYTEGPSVAQKPPGAQDTSQGSRSSGQQETQKERPYNLHNLHGNASISSRVGAVRSSSVEDSQSSIRTSVGSASSDQRLLGSPESSDQIIRIQPKHSELNSEELKPLNAEAGPLAVAPGNSSHKKQGKHSCRCEDCGRCQCSECRRPRALPSCWMCGRRCMCSAGNAVEYGTCVCCIKGLFYHCSSDDEDTCTDKPFSCTQSHCCVRWVTVSLLSLLFPCILCYLPIKGCVAVCQCCYDRVTRPGCRCKNSNSVHCEGVSKRT
ncbi:LOW QUALITY PROTEIN: protein sprouty homolog 2 [Archocentrus centrarchus]|uniref:LOW QUALITY PROTEIN: protein sprouty homolog 2 n=1 Tax=Archocentrus centrarchus TaxID=63155 RepID=UPI0011E9D1F3|nr:LOW QUALITY PROTEIN: protein sprouty homolog 2 [Archocentrus centrarchus]